MKKFKTKLGHYYCETCQNEVVAHHFDYSMREARTGRFCSRHPFQIGGQASAQKDIGSFQVVVWT